MAAPVLLSLKILKCNILSAMTTLAFSLIIFSSVMHALWNLLVKQSRHKTVFIWWMFVSSGLLFTLSLPFIPGSMPVPDREIILISIAGGSCFVLYHLFTGRAYHSGDLSLTYPLCQTSMIYVPIWGGLLIGEKLSAVGIGGILLVAAGAYTVQMQKLSIGELIRPFSNLKDGSVRAALAAGFIYSFGAMLDKAGVQRYSPLYFTWLMVVVMLFLMTVNLLRPRYRNQVVSELRENWKLILLSGPIMMASFLTFRYGLKLAPMSYAVPVRQVSILVGVLLGMLFLKESFGRIRLASALLILVGAFVIKFG
jgi:drug/metabolite transporter (DMT)-like permease